MKPSGEGPHTRAQSFNATPDSFLRRMRPPGVRRTKESKSPGLAGQQGRSSAPTLQMGSGPAGGTCRKGGQQQELSSWPGGSRGGSRERGKEPPRGQLGWGAVAQLQGRLQKERKKGRREGGFLWRRHRRTAIGEAPRDRRGGARRSGRGFRLEEARAAALGPA